MEVRVHSSAYRTVEPFGPRRPSRSPCVGWKRGRLIAAALALPLIAFARRRDDRGSPPDDLQGAKAATARYHSFKQALKNGYSVEGEPCVPPVSLSARRWASTSSLPTGQESQAAAYRSRVLEGRRRPVPGDLGRPAVALLAGRSTGQCRVNPSGLFAPFNPNLTCPGSQASSAGASEIKERPGNSGPLLSLFPLRAGRESRPRGSPTCGCSRSSRTGSAGSP